MEKEKYESPEFISLNDYEMGSVSGGGGFILIQGVTVAFAAFMANVGVAYNVLLGRSYIVSATKVTVTWD